MSNYEVLQTETQMERSRMLAEPLFADAMAGRVNTAMYIAFLTQAYHHVKHTVPLMMACGARLTDRHEWLRAKIVSYIEEEYGHHEWVLNDIVASGGDRGDARRSAPSFETEMMVAYAYDLIARGNPVSFFGMVHVLEGTSTALATHAAQQLAIALKLPKTAFSYLSSHGALDVSHVEFFRDLVNELTLGDLEDVIRSSRRFYRLYGAIFAALHRQFSPQES